MLQTCVGIGRVHKQEYTLLCCQWLCEVYKLADFGLRPRFDPSVFKYLRRAGIFHASDLALTRALTLMVSVLTVTEQRLSYLLRLLADPPSV